MSPELLALCACVLCIVFLLWWRKPHPKFPPGPRGLPIVGVFPFIKGHMHDKIMEWSKTYGPIMSARLGREDIVFLNDKESIYKVFVKHSTTSSGRPLEGFFNQVDGNFGVTSQDYSEDFVTQKHFGFKAIKRDLFCGKSMHAAVNEEADLLIDFLKTKTGTPIDIAFYFKRFTGNIVARFVCNTRFNYDDESQNNITTLTEKSTQQDKILLLCVFFNALMYLPPFSTACKKYMEVREELYGAFVKIIEEHESEFDPESRKDFIDEFLFEQKQNQNRNQNGDTGFTQKQLIMYCRSLFVAGTETTSITLSWAVLSLLHHPHLEEDLIKEIHECIGDKDTSASMKWDMPHFNAFFNEVMRYRPGAPFSVPHTATETIEVDDFVIPKGTQIFSNIYAAHHDATAWSDPETFRPDRFLRDDGRFNHRKLISSFGVGARSCLGEALAKLELVAAFSKLLRAFVITAADSGSLPSLDDSHTTLFFCPKAFDVVLEPRCR